LLVVANWRFLFWVLTAYSLSCLSLAFWTLEESRPPQAAPRVGPKLWLSLLTDRRFLRYSVPANLIQASVFAYIAGAPFVFIELLHLSPQQFACLFGINALGLLAAGRINAHLVTRTGPELLFRRAMLCTAGLCLAMFVIALSGRGGFWALAIPLFFYVASLGFNFANGFALTLAPFGSTAGTASALHGTMQFTIAGIGGVAVSTLYDGSPRAMTGIMCALTVAGATVYRAMQ